MTAAVADTAYKMAVSLNKLNGGDGECHTSMNEKGQNVYSGPMNSEEFDRMMNDPNSVLKIG